MYETPKEIAKNVGAEWSECHVSTIKWTKGSKEIMITGLAGWETSDGDIPLEPHAQVVIGFFDEGSMEQEHEVTLSLALAAAKKHSSVW